MARDRRQDARDLADLRRKAMARAARRIEAELRGMGEDLAGDELSPRTRGADQAVVALNAFGADGRRVSFPTETEAARFARVARGHHVARAIIRGGRCGGFLFRWSHREPTDQERARECRHLQRQAGRHPARDPQSHLGADRYE